MQAEWKTIGYNGMCLGNKGLVHMLSLHVAFSFQALSLSLTFSTSQTFTLLAMKEINFNDHGNQKVNFSQPLIETNRK